MKRKWQHTKSPQKTLRASWKFPCWSKNSELRLWSFSPAVFSQSPNLNPREHLCQKIWVKADQPGRIKKSGLSGTSTDLAEMWNVCLSLQLVVCRIILNSQRKFSKKWNTSKSHCVHPLKFYCNTNMKAAQCELWTAKLWFSAESGWTHAQMDRRTPCAGLTWPVKHFTLWWVSDNCSKVLWCI